MDASTGQSLYKRAPDLRLPPASTTKVVTAIVALERRRLDDLIRVTENVTNVPALRMGLRPGQTMTVEGLLYGALLYSANDASVVLAEGIGGTTPTFAKMMSRKARQVGATNSQFKNPHGLTEREHYSTARDLALIFNYAIKIPQFRKIAQTKRTTVNLFSAGTTGKVRRIRLRNKNRLLWDFEGAIGGKTGYTRAAKRCFVGAASRNGVTLVASVLGSRSLWTDTKRLLEYGFRTAPSRTASSNSFIVQVASFIDSNKAQSLREWIAKAGHKAYVERAPLMNGHALYRVRVGPYDELIHAQRALNELIGRNGFEAMILPAGTAASSGNGKGPDFQR
jgi:D-alanyl-D-alanine carboxypeptidase (penicillin-binding protein 5/6)